MVIDFDLLVFLFSNGITLSWDDFLKANAFLATNYHLKICLLEAG